MSELTHIDPAGNARMVDVGNKAATARTALAQGFISLSPAALRAIEENTLKKGNPLSVAQLAGIMGSKRTADLIPLCHPLPIDKVEVLTHIENNENPPRIRVTASVKTQGQTGVEMEALTAVSVACLTLYDMLKAIDKSLKIGPIELLEKTGGKSGDFRRNPA